MGFIDYVVGMAEKARRAENDPDPDTRRRAVERGSKWREVLAGMLSGRLRIGSRTPVEDLPVWVTPEVVRGGFVTGRALAANPLDPDEAELADELGLPRTRRALFDWWISPEGRAVLLSLLDDDAFSAHLSEHTALMAVALLHDRGDEERAARLIAELAPFRDRLRFVPHATTPSTATPVTVHRHTVARARADLAGFRTPWKVLAQQEALTVWIPLRDEVVTFLAELLTRDEPRPADLERAARLVAMYRDALRTHPHCRKYRRRGENLPLLIEELEQLGSAPWPSRRARRVLDDIERKRGLPHSDRARRLRAEQDAQASRPLHAEIGAILADRLSELRDDEGIPDDLLDDLTAPITVDEATARVPAGTEVPERLGLSLERAVARPLHLLAHSRGIIPSCEVLAEVAPQVTAWRLREGRDVRVGRLLGATHLAFSRRRSLLLTDLRHQVGLDELPWIRDLPGADHDPDALRRAACDLAARALASYPFTPFPNQLTQELDHLTRQAGDDLPWTRELAADIFECAFSPTFARAAREAASLLRGTLYERYYGLDTDLLSRVDAAAFTRWCLTAAPPTWRPGEWSVAVHGAIIERQQIATTHNLATAVALGVEPVDGWEQAGNRAIEYALWHLRHDPEPRRAARAWRQGVFHLSMAGLDAVLEGPWWKDLFADDCAHLRDDLQRAMAGEPVTPLLGWRVSCP